MKCLFAGVLFLLAASAQAAGSASVLTTGLAGSVRLEWLDVNHIRVDVSGQPGHLLLLKDHSYHIANVGSQVVATNLLVLARLIGPQNLPKPPQTAANATKIVSMDTAGYGYSVANVPGKIYNITWIASDGRRHTDIALLTRNATAIELTRVLRRVAAVLSRVADIENSDALGRVLEQRHLGLLHFGDQLHVESLSAAAPPATAFVLP